jgi:regulatory protein
VSKSGKITRIAVQQGNRNRFCVYLDGEFAFGLAASVLIKHNLRCGDNLSEADTQTILLAEDNRLAVDKAYALLARRDHSASELADKLDRRGHSAEAIQHALAEMLQHGYLDDARYARRYVRNRLQMRPMGKALLLQELYGKGVPRGDAEQAVREAFAQEDEQDLARRVAAKRAPFYRGETETRQKQKLSAYLRQRGFDWEVIKTAVSEQMDTCQESIENESKRSS